MKMASTSPGKIRPGQISLFDTVSLKSRPIPVQQTGLLDLSSLKDSWEVLKTVPGQKQKPKTKTGYLSWFIDSFNQLKATVAEIITQTAAGVRTGPSLSRSQLIMADKLDRLPEMIINNHFSYLNSQNQAADWSAVKPRLAGLIDYWVSLNRLKDYSNLVDQLNQTGSANDPQDQTGGRFKDNFRQAAGQVAASSRLILKHHQLILAAGQPAVKQTGPGSDRLDRLISVNQKQVRQIVSQLIQAGPDPVIPASINNLRAGLKRLLDSYYQLIRGRLLLEADKTATITRLAQINLNSGQNLTDQLKPATETKDQASWQNKMKTATASYLDQILSQYRLDLSTISYNL